MLVFGKLKQKTRSLLNSLKSRLSKITVKIWIILLAIILILLYVFNFIIPKSIVFTYAETKHCISQFVLLPGLQKQPKDENFKIKTEGGVKIGSFYLFSNEICITPATAPSVGDEKINLSPFGWIIFRNSYNIHVGDRPKVSASTDQPVAIAKPLKFNLDKIDKIFAYKIEINSKTGECNNESDKVSCDIKTLSLKQGEKYPYKLTRTFNNTETSSAIEGYLSLLSPTTITSTSIKSGEMVYSNPKSFTFETDKKLISANVILEKNENGTFIKVDSTSKISGSTIETSIASDLGREVKYRLTIDKAEGEDGSVIDSPNIIDFQTSGGPVVSSINIGTSGIDSNARILVTFDQPISDVQDISQLVDVVGGDASVSRTSNQIIFKLNSLPRCGAFSININKGINSQYGFSSTADWSYTSRVSCRSTEIIGYSVLGKPIYAYYYGNGPTTILFNGGIHGSEQSGKSTMLDWVYYLDSYAYKIPADRRVVIVPSVNPDGLATSSRYNVNNVNIDRNFASSNWQTDIDTSTGIILGGGGTQPESEPETKALADLTRNLMPRLIVSFHAQGRLVGANQVGDSIAIGNLYAADVGYSSMIGIAEEVMGYSITGEYEEWAGEKYGIPAILIELPTASGSYFSSNQSTIWKMVSI